MDIIFISKLFTVTILIFVLLYSMIKKNKILGENNYIDLLVSFLFSALLLYSGAIVFIIEAAVNFFILIIFFVFLLMFLTSFLGFNIFSDGGLLGSKGILSAILIIVFLIATGFSSVKLINTFENNPNEISQDEVQVQKIESEKSNSSFINFDNEKIGILAIVLILLIISGIGIFMREK